jgi:hypothetical protein
MMERKTIVASKLQATTRNDVVFVSNSSLISNRAASEVVTGYRVDL